MSKKVPNSEGTQFKPGQTGNAHGRPKKLPAIDKLMADVLGSEDDDNDNSEAKAILNALVTRAKKGDTRAAEILLDRGYGKPKQQVEIQGDPVKTYVINRASTRDKGD